MKKKVIVIGAICVIALICVGIFTFCIYPNIAAKRISQQISDIGTVTLESRADIEAARVAYDGCRDSIKEGVTNLDVLEEAERTIDRLEKEKAEKEKKLVRSVENKIYKIGTVTLGSNKKIKAARTAYDNLDSSLQDRVTNYNDLTKAEEKYKKLKKKQEKAKVKARVESLKSKMRRKYDKVEGISWYYPSNFPYYANTRSYVLPYIGKMKEGVWLRLVFRYTEDDWIFWNSLKIVVDGKTYTPYVPYSEIERDNGGGDVWEYWDCNPSSSDIKMLEAISKSKQTIVRFQGDNYRYDLYVSAADKKAIRDTLALYRAFNKLESM